MTIDYTAMSPEELLNRLEHTGPLPDMELIRACMEQREAITPGLLPMLEHYYDESWSDDDPRWSASLHAGLLLIAFREPAALPIFSTVFRGNVDEVDSLIEWFHPELPAYGPAAVPYFMELLDDDQTSDYGYSLGLEVITDIALLYPESREQIIEQLHGYLPALTETEDEAQLGSSETTHREDPQFATMLSYALLKLGDTASRDQVIALYRQHLIDEAVMGPLESYLRDLEKPREQPRVQHPGNILKLYEALHEREQFEARMRAEAEQRAIAAQMAAARTKTTTASAKGKTAKSTASAGQQTVVRSQPKVGRNDPCPCGSGRKYKHCCGK